MALPHVVGFNRFFDQHIDSIGQSPHPRRPEVSPAMPRYPRLQHITPDNRKVPDGATSALVFQPRQPSAHSPGAQRLC